jgi:hypothetical protein
MALARPNARPSPAPAIPRVRHAPRSGAANAVARPTLLAAANPTAHFPLLVAGLGLSRRDERTALRVDGVLNSSYSA